MDQTKRSPLTNKTAMTFSWKRIPLAAYYYGTLPYRWWWNARAVRQGRAPVTILFYHRVADDPPSVPANGWTISNDDFTRQIEWLRKRFDMVSLEEAQRRLRGGTCQRPAVSITFDDGYAENCQHALPFLIREKIPCTYFVCTDNVLQNIPFPHDVALGRPLPVNTVEQLTELSAAGIEIGGHTRTHIDLGQIDDPQRLRDEIVTAGKELGDAIGQPIRYFAFPFGLHQHLNAQAFAVAKEAGYEAICSAYGGYNFPGDDPFHLQRFHGDPEMLRLMNWTSGDPRKRHRIKRFVTSAAEQ